MPLQKCYDLFTRKQEIWIPFYYISFMLNMCILFSTVEMNKWPRSEMSSYKTYIATIVASMALAPFTTADISEWRLAQCVRPLVKIWNELTPTIWTNKSILTNKDIFRFYGSIAIRLLVHEIRCNEQCIDSWKRNYSIQHSAKNFSTNHFRRIWGWCSLRGWGIEGGRSLFVKELHPAGILRWRREDSLSPRNRKGLLRSGLWLEWKSGR